MAGMVNAREIQRRRELLKLNQPEAAARAGFKTAQQWNNIEKGHRANVRADTLASIARALGCTMEELMTAPEPSKPKRRR